MVKDNKLLFWDSRAEKGEQAGTNDFLLKDLEMGVLRDRIGQGATVLDAGCGNGKTLVDLAVNKNCSGLGFDFSIKMIAAAELLAAEHGVERRVRFETAGLLSPPGDSDSFDYVISERSLINLDSHEEQHQAFKVNMDRLRPGGCYLMIESSRQGLDRINALRKILDLNPIEAPWHNTFIDEQKVESWRTDRFILKEIIPLSSTYYFLSRVVYAKLAHDAGEELRYDSDINLIAAKLPPIGDLGPTRLWRWRKK